MSAKAPKTQGPTAPKLTFTPSANYQQTKM
jgi:hypothetical protein